MFVGQDGYYPAGIYRAEWDGNGTVTWDFDAREVERGVTAGGRHYALLEVTPGDAGIYMQTEAIDESDPPCNFSVWMPDYNGQSFVHQQWTPGSDFSPFHPLFIQRLRPFKTLRFMQFPNGSDQDTVAWSDRRTVDDARQQSGAFSNGAAVEYMVAMANEIGADAWLSMPYMANDDFVLRYATLVRDTLDPQLEVYVEWANEVWNYGVDFRAFHWVSDQLELPENAGVDRWKFEARQTKRDFDIWSEVFASQEDRLVRVVAGQSGVSWIAHRQADLRQTVRRRSHVPDPREAFRRGSRLFHVRRRRRGRSLRLHRRRPIRRPAHLRKNDRSDLLQSGQVLRRRLRRGRHGRRRPGTAVRFRRRRPPHSRGKSGQTLLRPGPRRGFQVRLGSRDLEIRGSRSPSHRGDQLRAPDAGSVARQRCLILF